MKKLFIIPIVLLAFGCGGTSNGQESLTMEEENALADSITTQLKKEETQLNQTTEESLDEIDSLLETL